MAYCGPKGIPLSTFLAWPEEDQQAALAWQAYEAKRCPSCGSHPEDFSREGDERHFHHRHCLGCVRLDNAQKSIPPGDAAISVVAAHGSAKDCPTCNPPTPS